MTITEGEILKAELKETRRNKKNKKNKHLLHKKTFLALNV